MSVSVSSATGYLDIARDVAQNVTAAHVTADDIDARWPAETIRALAEAGVTGLMAPRSVGGLEAGMQGLVAVAEILASESASAGLCFAMHCVGTAVIAAKATPDQRDRYLVPIAQGKHITTLAVSEPGTGAFFYYPQSRIARAGDGMFELTGTKSFVTNGTHADSYVVSTAPLTGESDDGQFNCVLVDRDRPGLSFTDEWRGFGMRSNDSRTMRMEQVRIPAGNLLGEIGDQLWYIFEVVAPYFLMGMAGTYIGVAQAALDEARAHVGTRRHAHSGELLGSGPVVSHRLGDLWIRLEGARQLVASAALKGDTGAPDALAAILASKVAASNAAVEIANEAMTLCGGSAYRENARLARILRDARASHVMAPTTDQLKMWLGRVLLNLPLL